MGKLFFKLHDVPEHEAEEVRHMLDKAGIAYYETSAGNWGVSLAALWLAQESDLENANALLTEFQEKWRQESLAARESEPQETLMSRLKREPVKVTLAIIAVAAILYLSIMPFTGAWS
ncbi:hypothetical protein R50072_00770 [Simiduia litorea]|uniref:DUF6164 family protein n=1 Tax=Simiduia litorea TaxID=1435348 RepID=UPI0036F1B6D1